MLEVGGGVSVEVELEYDLIEIGMYRWRDEVELEVEVEVWMEVVVLLGEVFCWMELEDGCSSSFDETIGIALEELQPIVGNWQERRRVSLRLGNMHVNKYICCCLR